jgi:hypothetical protein
MQLLPPQELPQQLQWLLWSYLYPHCDDQCDCHFDDHHNGEKYDHNERMDHDCNRNPCVDGKKMTDKHAMPMDRSKSRLCSHDPLQTRKSRSFSCESNHGHHMSLSCFSSFSSAHSQISKWTMMHFALAQMTKKAR